MTRKFAEELKARMKCRQCRHPSMALRKFCPKHLERARQNWQRHSENCTRLGRCIDCHSKKLPAEQRCGGCKAENRQLCKAWWLRNVCRLRARYYSRLTKGLCGSCGLRRAVKGHVGCVKCRPRGYKS